MVHLFIKLGVQVSRSGNTSNTSEYIPVYTDMFEVRDFKLKRQKKVCFKITSHF